jgi:hypothetical protein
MLSDLMILIIQHFSQLVVSLSAKETLLNERFESFLHRFPRTIGRFSVVIASEAFIGTSRLQSIFAEEVCDPISSVVFLSKMVLGRTAPKTDP